MTHRFARFRIAVLVLVGSALICNVAMPGHVTYLCRMTGQVLDECCCVTATCKSVHIKSYMVASSCCDIPNRDQSSCDEFRLVEFAEANIETQPCSESEQGGCCDLSIVPAKPATLSEVTFVGAKARVIQLELPVVLTMAYFVPNKCAGVVQLCSHHHAARGSPPLLLMQQVFRL